MTATSDAAPRTSAAERPMLPSPGRSGAWLAALALPAWIVTFVVLTAGFGLKSESGNGVMSPLEQAAFYQGSLGAAWLFGIVSVIAVALLAGAPALLAVALARLGRFRVLSIVVAVLAGVTLVVEFVGLADYFGLLVAPPDALPGWVSALAEPSTNDTVNAVAWGAVDLAVPLIGFLLFRARVLGRIGLIVAIIGAALFLVSVPFLFFQPMAPAVLLLVLGVPLLRRRK